MKRESTARSSAHPPGPPPSGRGECRVVLAALVLLCVALPSCASPTRTSGQSTVITNEDLTEITTEITERLKASDFLAQRTPDSPPLTITLRKVINYTSDVLREGDRWYLMYRVLDSFSIRTLSQEKNIRIVIPVERLAELRANVSDAERAASLRAPTHVMEAIFRSVTASSGKDRTDAYYCQYRVTELAVGEVVWSDRFEFKRAAVGRAYN